MKHRFRSLGITANLAIVSGLVLFACPRTQAQPATQFTENFNSYAAGEGPGGFVRGGSSNGTWSISSPGASAKYRSVITNPSGIGGSISYVVRGVPYMGGLHRKNFTVSSTFRVVSGGTGYTIGLMGFAGTHPYSTTGGPYYWFSLDQNGTIKIRTSWDNTTGLTLGTATNLSGGIVVGTTYTFTVQGTYSGNSLTMDFSVTGGANAASISATASTALTGLNFGYQNRVGPAGTSMTVDVDDLSFSVPMTFTQVWEDEFNGTTLDTSVWTKGYRHADVINNELQAFRPENVVIGNGLATFNVSLKRGQINNAAGYAVGATVLNVDGFTEAIPNGTTIRVGTIDPTHTMPNGSVDQKTYVVASTVGGSTPTQITLQSGLRWAAADNTRVIITAKNNSMGNYEWGAFDYRSGAIQSYNKWTKTYGYFEARVKMASGMGTWPAFWLLPDRGPSYTVLDQRVAVGNVVDGVSIPMGGEIDIFEYMNAWTNPTTLLSKIHHGLIWKYGTTGNATTGYGQLNHGFGPTLWYDPEGSFHKYGVYWEPGVVTFYVDDQVVLTRQHATNVPITPEYIILNVAITQNDWHGNTIPISAIDAGVTSAMEVDYVRVYDVTPGATASTREPVADAYVRDGTYQNTNYGTATNLATKLDVATYNRETYLRFSAAGLGSASNVRLRLVPITVGADPATLRFDFVTNDTWTETGLTWTNKPASSGTVFATMPGPFTVNQAIEVDVTTQAQAAANGDGYISIKVLGTVSGSSRNVDFASREHATVSYRPVLVY